MKARSPRSTESCPICGGRLKGVSERREVRVGQRSARVRDEFDRCEACGEEFYAPGQMNATLLRASEVIRDEEGLLRPEEIKRVREALGLSQRAFETLLGVGPKTVVRWEKGTVFQNKATDSLIRIIAVFPEAAVFLGDRHSVPLALATPTPGA